MHTLLAATAAAHVAVSMLRRRLRAPSEAAGSAASTTLPVLAVLETLASRCGFGGFGGWRLAYGNEAARELYAVATMAT